MVALLKLNDFHEKFIEFVIPTDKENLYYEPTDKLHKFDLVQVFYVDSYKRKFIVEDALIEVVLSFFGSTKNIVNRKLQLFEKIEPGKFGYFYNYELYTNRLWYEDNVLKYVLWGVGGVRLAIYAFGAKVYIEIFTVFSFGEDSSDEEDAENFKKFMKNYAPIGVMELDKDILQKWREQVKDFFEIQDDAISY